MKELVLQRLSCRGITYVAPVMVDVDVVGVHADGRGKVV